MSQDVAIAVVLVIENDRVLVGQRPLTAASAAGYAEFPGGKIEAGEDATSAARRECLEETGLNVLVEDLMASNQLPEGGGRIDFFSGRLSDTTTTVPHSPFTWLTAKEVADCRFPPANTAAVRWLMQQLNSFPEIPMNVPRKGARSGKR